MPSFDPNWDASWASSSIDGSTLANGASLTTGEISGDDKTTTEVAVEVLYASTANEGVKVYVLRDVGGTYQVVADNPFGFEMPKTASATRRYTFSVPANMVSKFKVHLTNDSGASVTATVKTKQATIDQH